MKQFTLSIVMLFSLIGFSHHGLEGTIGTNGNITNGLTVLGKGSFLFNTNYFYWGYEGQTRRQYNLSNVLDINYSQVGQAQIMYGITDRLTVGIQQAYGQVEYTPLFLNPDYFATNFHGLNDMGVFGLYEILHETKLKLAILAGLEVPTGTASYRENNVLNTVGSISWDPQIGYSSAIKWGRSSVRSQGLFVYTTDNKDEYNYGHFCNANLMYDFRMEKKDSTTQTAGAPLKKWSFDAQAGFHYEWLGENTSKDVIIPNTGGHRLFSVIGIQTTYRQRLIIPVNIELPLWEERLNGLQNTSAIRLRVGVSYLLTKLL